MINDATKFAYLIAKNESFARPSRAFLFLCISFSFSANLRREMTISQVLQRTCVGASDGVLIQEKYTYI